MKNSELTYDESLQRLGDLFFRLGKGIAAEYGHELICITPALDKVLLVVGSEKNINIKRVAAIFMITSGAVTQHVAALEKLGAIERAVGHEDRREINVRLTAKGEELYAQIKANSLHVMRDIFKDLNDSELKFLIELMSKASKKYEIKE